MKEAKFWYWHVDIDTTKIGLERFARALLKTGSGLECGRSSRLLPAYPFGRGVTALVVVQVPDGQQDEFRCEAKPVHMTAPAIVDIDPRPVRDDGHPGRKDSWDPTGMSGR
jgi:hypothetical protein